VIKTIAGSKNLTAEFS